MIRKILLAFICISLGNIAFAQNNKNVDDHDSFLKFQQNMQLKNNVSEDDVSEFYGRSWAFWMKNKVDYNDHPEKYAEHMKLYHLNQEKYKRDRQIAIDRFEDTIEMFRRFDNRNSLATDPVLFVGSSSIVYWETAKSFPDLPIINRGFGGASLPEIIHYYDDVIKKHNPSMMVLYCDIDVENGKSPEFSVNAFKELIDKVDQDFPGTPILIMAMKPTLIDDMLGKDVRKNKMITNEKMIEYTSSKENLHFVDISSPMLDDNGKLRSDIFISDGMHLNPLGYTLWDPLMRKEIERFMER